MIPASTLDVSSGGLRIRTLIRLSVGKLVNVQFQSDRSGLRQYEVVWAKSAGARCPGQAGLRAVRSASQTPPASLGLSRLESEVNTA